MVLKVVTFKADEDLVEKIDEYASILGISRSELIRMALERIILEMSKIEGREINKERANSEVVIVI
ncbi:ribbon-helix-helix protein, CopG family [Staphylothermus hellenicus]|uniref:CopG domain protein DNA-binding domain protein n=1 Tax=Staphylothermus hellenicus (strain DSM 12710 / JCM 10830 / BK20S6-10-b1 / P8) TaxID=591019 RepID=D7D9H1_STAHD|nr:ribbon-helix-helix protein, CopG family [Staphylothermus hellenicus]ADI32417.1 CopG domain protein DNA-binding domain protein [Staphylothermus hellenicus DSM 12710]